MEVTVKIIRIGEIKQITEKFKKRDLVAEFAENEKYPQTIQFQLSNNFVEAVEGYNPGDYVKITFTLAGREYTNPKGETTVFTNLNVLKIESVDKESSGNNSTAIKNEKVDYKNLKPKEENDDDLPF